MKQQMSCRDMELLYRQRAVFDSEHSWKWLGEAERWGHLAQKETASRFKEIGLPRGSLLNVNIQEHCGRWTVTSSCKNGSAHTG
jgi:hypothetical protein